MNNNDKAPRIIIAHDGSRFEQAARRDTRTFSMEGVKAPDTSKNRSRAARKNPKRRFHI
jgi:hypothetical protein